MNETEYINMQEMYLTGFSGGNASNTSFVCLDIQFHSYISSTYVYIY